MAVRNAGFASQLRAAIGAPGLAFPALALVSVAFLWPVLRLLTTSITTPSFGFDHYQLIFTDGISVTILVRTLVTSVCVAAICLVIAFPYAYLMSNVGDRARAVLMVVALAPFWASLMARTLGWHVLLSDNGVINDLAGAAGLGPFKLLGNTIGVTIGTVQVLLPFMVLPLYNAMSKIDRRYAEAARGLGASRTVAFWTVFVPLARPGMIAGTTLVYVLALGFFVTPQILGSPQQSLIAQQIATEVGVLQNFALAGALSAVLLIAAFVPLFVMSKLMKMTRVGTQEGSDE